VWTFGRGTQRVEIRRWGTPDEPVLEIVGGDAPGTTAFKDMAALVSYQAALESRLVAGGWSLLTFEPERRSGADRRVAARDAFDRRRWWTDPEFRRRKE
jgi:hypothetical protein